MSFYVLSEPAEKDLEEIFAYTLETWGEKQFFTYRSLLVNAFEELADNPEKLGTKGRDDLAKGCRSIHVERHQIFYRKQDKGIQIIRVLYDRMDFKRHLRKQ